MEYKNVLEQVEDLITRQEYDNALELIDKSLESVGQTKERYQLANAKVVVYLSQSRYQEALEVHKSGIFAGIWSFCAGLASPEHLDNVYNAIEINHGLGDVLAEERCKYMYHHFNREEESRAYVNNVRSIVKNLEEHIISGTRDFEILKQLAELYIIQSEGINACVAISAIQSNLSKEKISEYEEALWLVNFLRIHIKAMEKINIFAEICENDIQSKALAHMAAVSDLNRPVYYIKYPLTCEVESIELEKEDILKVILDNKTIENNITYVTPLLLMDKRGNTYDTTSIILEYLADHVVGGDSFFMRIEEERFLDVQDTCSPKTGCGVRYREMFWLAEFDLPDRPRMCLVEIYNKVKKYSKAYGFDILAALDAPPEVRISIVIPTRNCPNTLRYTLMTCIEQDYEDYEIVLSDNGEPGDSAVFDLAEELNAKCVAEGRIPKIRYYHTPGLLPLPKSFEYAYLLSRGEFVFGLGSDDAVMPGGLRLLAQYLDQYPEAEVIQWSRNTYFWPDLPMGGADMLIYNTKREDTAGRVSCDELFRLLQDQNIGLYRLPLCYINSCMSRSYMKRIVDVTGTLIGGVCQDLYIAAVNLYLLKHIVFTTCTITVAGQCSRSIGLTSSVGNETKEEMQKATAEWKSMHVPIEPETRSQQLMPATNWDVACFYNQLLRVKDMKIGRLRGDDTIDYKELFIGALEHLNTADLSFQGLIDNLERAAEKHGDEFAKWFAPWAKKCRDLQNTQATQSIQVVAEGADKSSESLPATPKAYKEEKEPNAEGYVTLDMSNYGISNIYDAIKFAEKLYK